MIAKDKAEILANKASYSYMTDSSCKTVANHILKVIPLTELLAVAEAATYIYESPDSSSREYKELQKLIKALRAKLPKGIEL